LIWPTCNLASKSAQLTVNLSDFNQNGLRPFLEPLLADKNLSPLPSTATPPFNTTRRQLDRQGRPAGDHLVVSDPNSKFQPRHWRPNCKLTPPCKTVGQHPPVSNHAHPHQTRAKSVQLQGQLDFSQTNAIQGNLKLSADSLDVTRYYDLFAGAPKSAAGNRRRHPVRSGLHRANQEPPA